MVHQHLYYNLHFDELTPAVLNGTGYANGNV